MVWISSNPLGLQPKTNNLSCTGSPNPNNSGHLKIGPNNAVAVYISLRRRLVIVILAQLRRWISFSRKEAQRESWLFRFCGGFGFFLQSEMASASSSSSGAVVTERRGIPAAQFVEDVRTYLSQLELDVQSTLAFLQERYSPRFLSTWFKSRNGCVLRVYLMLSNLCFAFCNIPWFTGMCWCALDYCFLVLWSPFLSCRLQSR